MKKYLFLLSAGLVLMAAAAEEPNFIIPRVETASTGWKLDGKLDDKVWKKAADISDFKPAKLKNKLVLISKTTTTHLKKLVN